MHGTTAGRLSGNAPSARAVARAGAGVGTTNRANSPGPVGASTEILVSGEADQPCRSWQSPAHTRISGRSEHQRTRALSLIEGLHDKVRDVSLICEGTRRFVGEKSLLPEGTDWDKRYQCQYYYRHDGACRFELYLRGNDIDSLFGHSTWALLGRRLEKLDRSPSSKDLAKVQVARGTNGALRVTGSPHHLIWIWYFQMVSGREARDYEYQGWK